ncbi:MAG TPA: hypothetical protein VF808_03820 [Ktedonobacterales bacterium]
MPNRYEREIEEILNRMEESEPKKGLGDRIRPFRRRPARPPGLPTPQIPLLELVLLMALLLILVAAGLAFYQGEATAWSGWIGLAGVALFVVALVAGWRDRFRPSTFPRWRAHALGPTPLRRSPLSALSAQIRIWRLRQQYRRGQSMHDESDN